MNERARGTPEREPQAATAAAAGPPPSDPADIVPPVESRRVALRADARTAATLAAGFAAGILAVDLFRNILGRVQGLVIVVLVSLFLSFAMEPAVQYLARRGLRRGVGTWVVFLGATLLMAGFVAAMAPLVVDQVRTLVEEGPAVLQDLADRAATLPGGLGEGLSAWLEEARRDLPTRIPDMAGRVGGGLLGVGTTLLGAVLQGLTILLVTFYLVADGPKLRRTLVSRMPPERQREVLTVWELAVAKTGGYVYSRLLTAVASALFHIAVFTIIGVPYAVALGVWVGIVSSVIPVVGTYLAGFLPIVIALATDPITAVWVVVAIVIYQQVENYLIAPRITARTMELHPAVAFLSVLAGGALLGAVGALLALPAAAIATALVSAAGERHELVAHELLKEIDPSGQTDVIRTYGSGSGPKRSP